MESNKALWLNLESSKASRGNGAMDIENANERLVKEQKEEISRLSFEIIELKQKEYEMQDMLEIEKSHYQELQEEFEREKKASQVDTILLTLIIDRKKKKNMKRESNN